MNIGGMGGGDGRWGVKDSANSFVQYHLANDKSGGGGYHPGGRNPLAQLFKGIFLISLVIGLCVFISADMDPVAAVFLALAVSTILALLPVAAIWLWLRRKAKDDRNKTDQANKELPVDQHQPADAQRDADDLPKP